MTKLVLVILLWVFPGIAWPESPGRLRPPARPPHFLEDRTAEMQAVPEQTAPSRVIVASTDGKAVPSAAGPAPRKPAFFSSLRPPARSGLLPRTRWQHMVGNAIWTRSTLAVLKTHGKPLVDMVPQDIETWCPAYPQATHAQRRAFWVGFLSALAKFESTYKPWAVGGGGRWFGLLQILPSTARGYKCHAGTGEALKNGSANLSCAVRIMARTVPRDGVIYAPGGRGVAADWGPMRSAAKRADMARWLRRQSYCTPLSVTRPRMRP